MRRLFELGETIRQRWHARSFREDELPVVACHALEEFRLDATLDVDSIADWLFGSPHLPFQVNQNITFGQPPLTVYYCDQFYIELLFWLDATTTIHQHSFWGAFSVLVGSSVHSEYTFRERELVTSRLRFGDLSLRSLELLSAGATRPIRAGERFIHSLFHLDQPSVSIVVRTYNHNTGTPQYDYMRPGVALDPTHEQQLIRRQIQLLQALDRMNSASFVARSDALIKKSDLPSAFRILRVLQGALLQRGALDDVLQSARRSHGARFDPLIPALAHLRHDLSIIERRSRIRDPDQRYFLALLLNVPNRELLLDLVRQRYPGRRPEHQIVTWLRQLAKADALELDLDDVQLTVLRHALSGATTDEIAAKLKSRYRPSDVERQRGRLEELCRDLAAIPLFEPLFA